MPRLAQLTTAVDRRLVGLISTRARRRSPILRLVPDQWLGALLASSVSQLRNRLVTGLIAVSILILGAALWLTLP